MVDSLCVRLWGVRGSIPAPGPDTVRYGGNTTCLSVHLGADKVLVLDAGTGIRALGQHLQNVAGDIYILLTHDHWDHIQGFPFFAPIYQPQRKIYVFPTGGVGKRMLCSLVEQMDGAHFPITPEQLLSHIECITTDPLSFLNGRGIAVTRLPINHPGGGYGYRIQHAGRAVVFMPDNELQPPYPRGSSHRQFVDFCRDADVLIHDAQYLASQMPEKLGWGHSTIEQTCQLAAEARVKHLVLFHHDPERSDDELDALQRQWRQWFHQHHSTIECSVAREGMELTW